MRNSFRLSVLAMTLGTAIGFSQTAPGMDVSLDPVLGPVISWDSELDYYYHLWVTVDFESWGIAVMNIEGDGGLIEYEVDVQGLTGLDQELANQAFFRVEVTEEPLSFLVLPKQDAQIEIQEGVCFAFNLNIFHQLPSKIRVYMKEDNSGSNWAPIGLLQDFNEIDGVKFLQGSVIWLPDQIGDYQVKVTAFDAADSVMDEVERDITITSNQIPFVNITFGPANPEYGSLFPYIETSHSDNVVRVDFFDNGVWMGHDTEFPFGDWIEDLQGNRYMIENGQHNITAKAYNNKGVESAVSSVYQFVMDDQFSIINSKPVVQLVGSGDRVVLARGYTLEIDVTVSDADGANDLRKVSLYKGIVHSDPGCLVEIATDDILPLDHLAVDTSNWELGVHLVKIHAFDATGLGAQGVQLSTSQGVSYPIYLEVEIHDGSGTSFADSLLDVLVDDAGSNLQVSNSRFNGIQRACGVFDQGIDSGLLMTEGVVFTTGEYTSWNAGDLYEGTEKIWCSPGSLDLDLDLGCLSLVSIFRKYQLSQNPLHGHCSCWVALHGCGDVSGRWHPGNSDKGIKI